MSGRGRGRGGGGGEGREREERAPKEAPLKRKAGLFARDCASPGCALRARAGAVPPRVAGAAGPLLRCVRPLPPRACPNPTPLAPAPVPPPRAVPPMMYGFGDVDKPLPETVALVEARRSRGAARCLRAQRGAVQRAHAQPPAALPRARRRPRAQEMVCDYVSGMVSAAAERASLRFSKPGTEDVVAVVRGDPARLARAKELLNANEELKRARKMMETDEKALEAL
jgi:hypothetical protein